MPSSSRSFAIRRVISAVSFGFMPAVGSSRSRSFGSHASARAISRRRWSPYGRLRASSSSRSGRPTSAISSRARTRPASSSRVWRRDAKTASTERCAQPGVHADEHVLHGGHVLEETDVLERAADAGRDDVVRAAALEDADPRQEMLVPERPNDREQQHRDQEGEARSGSRSRRRASCPSRARRGRRGARR